MTAVVFIDEAQTVPLAVLAEVPAAFAAVPGAHLMQLVIVGQPALTAVLERPELRPLAERVDLRLELGPLAGDEIAGYITHRLSVAGASGRVAFSDAAVARIARLSQGVPRVVNLLSDRALARASRESASGVDARLIDVAAQELDLASPAGNRRTVARGLLIALALAALVLAGAAGAAWVFRGDTARALQQWIELPPAPRAPVLTLARPIPDPRARGRVDAGNLARRPPT